MSETFDEYKARLVSYVGERDPLEILRESPSALEQLVAGRAAERLTAAPAPGKWSVAEILAHLVDDELILGYRMRSVLVTPRSEIVSFDQRRWSDTLRYGDIPVSASLNAFRAFRDWNLELVGRLSPAEWDTFGIHQERGKESVRDMVRLYAGHDVNHTNQIRRIIAAPAA